MTRIMTQPTTTAEWHTLIQEGQDALAIELGEELESYLVFLLMRFTLRPELASSVIAIDWLKSNQLTASAQKEHIQMVGDQCLLVSGFFPGRAERKQVDISYFVKMGQSAYSSLSDNHSLSLAKLYQSLCKNFVILVETLHAIRELPGQHCISPLQALDFWEETGSQMALEKIMVAFTNDAFPVVGDASALKH